MPGLMSDRVAFGENTNKQIPASAGKYGARQLPLAFEPREHVLQQRGFLDLGANGPGTMNVIVGRKMPFGIGIHRENRV